DQPVPTAGLLLERKAAVLPPVDELDPLHLRLVALFLAAHPLDAGSLVHPGKPRSVGVVGPDVASQKVTTLRPAREGSFINAVEDLREVPFLVDRIHPCGGYT